MSSEETILDLPEDIWTLILKKLEVEDLLNLRGTCKKLRATVSDNTLGTIFAFNQVATASVFKNAEVEHVVVKKKKERNDDDVVFTTSYFVEKTQEFVESKHVPSFIRRHFKVDQDGSLRRITTHKAFLRQKKLFFSKSSYNNYLKTRSYNFPSLSMGMYLTRADLPLDPCGWTYPINPQP